MRHALIGLRAFGEAVFWGTVGGGAWGLLLWVSFGGLEGLWDTWLVGPREWLMYVVGPGLAAVAMGAWRGPAILRSDVPQLRRRGDVVA